MFKNINKYLIPIAIVIAGFLISQGLYYLNQDEVPGALSAEKAAEKAMNFINQVALQGQATAFLSEVSEESGLYKIKIDIEGEKYDSFVSKDGKLLFSPGTKITDTSNTSSGESKFSKSDVSQVQLFVMSFCPYGNQAEELMMPVAKLLGNKADIKLHYVIYSNYGDKGPNYCFDKEAKYCSIHGIQELNQGVRELCVQKYQKDKLWDFVKAINDNCNYQDVDSCWEGVARQVGVDIAKVKTCYKNEALDILAQEVELNEKYGVKGSPQLFINETEYQGSRSSEAYKQGICSAFNSAPDECSQRLSNEGGSASGACE